MDHAWTCRCCGRSFTELPMDYGIEAPDNWLALTEAERTQATLTGDLCSIGSDHYVRGCVEIAVRDCAEPFVWGVWVSISDSSLQRILALWDATAAELESEPPRTGWLCTWIKGYPEPKAIRCRIHLRAEGLRPRILLEPTGYPLAVEQYEGITLDRVKAIAAASGHSQAPAQ